MSHTEVILVDTADNATGIMEKMQAHRDGVLHRAFSIFIFNKNGEMLLQQRAMGKYHSGGLWTNACCSHPLPGEYTTVAAHRRLKEELGFETPIHKIFDFVYKADMGNGLIEYEFDHVFTGEYEAEINFNREEVMDFCFRSMSDIQNDLTSHPEKYTAWFRLAFPRIEQWWQEAYIQKQG